MKKKYKKILSSNIFFDITMDDYENAIKLLFKNLLVGIYYRFYILHLTLYFISLRYK